MGNYEELKNELEQRKNLIKGFPEETQGRVLDVLVENFLKDRVAGENENKNTIVEHETLLKELHNIDHITEIHAATIISISSALLGLFAFRPKGAVLFIIPIIGVGIAVEWLFKVSRHRGIFRNTHRKITALEKKLKIDALRPLPPHRYVNKVFSKDGFTILGWFASGLLALWLSLFILYLLGVLH